MAKTKPIGVRFNDDILGELKKCGCTTPQKALSFLELFWAKSSKISVQNLNNPTHEIKPSNPPQTNYSINTKQIAELEKELAAIPDKSKGWGRALAKSIQKKINTLKSLKDFD